MVIAMSCVLTLGALAAPPAYFKTNWADAQRAARTADRLLFIHFTVSWSGEDREMETRVLATAAVQKALADFVPVSLDCTISTRDETAPEARAANERMKACGGESHPFFVVATPDGDFLYAIRGYLSGEELIARLGKAKETRAEYDAFLAYAAKADKDSPEFKIRQLKFLVKFRKFLEASSVMESMLGADPDGSKGLAGEARLAMILIAPSGEGPAKTQGLYETVKSLDPRNERGLWERAVQAQGERYYRHSLRSETEADFRAKLAKPTAMVEELIDNAARFDDRRAVYHMALFLYTSQKKFDKAHAAIDDLLKNAAPAEKHAVQKLRLELFVQQEQFAQARSVVAELVKTASPAEAQELQRRDKELELQAAVAGDKTTRPAAR